MLHTDAPGNWAKSSVSNNLSIKIQDKDMNKSFNRFLRTAALAASFSSALVMAQAQPAMPAQPAVVPAQPAVAPNQPAVAPAQAPKPAQAQSAQENNKPVKAAKGKSKKTKKAKKSGKKK